MKKNLFAIIAVVSMLTACKKENTREYVTQDKAIADQIVKVQEMFNATSLGSFQEVSRSVESDVQAKRCRPIPTAVGQAIGVTAVLEKSILIRYGCTYQFYVEGESVSSTMQLRISWINARGQRTSIYRFNITATDFYDEYGLAIIYDIQVPKDKVITCTVTGRNNCGQKSKYEAQYIYSSTQTRSSNNSEMTNLLKKTTSITTVTGQPTIVQ